MPVGVSSHPSFSLPLLHRHEQKRASCSMWASASTSTSPRRLCRLLVSCDGGIRNKKHDGNLGTPRSSNWSPTNIRTMMYSGSLNAIMDHVPPVRNKRRRQVARQTPASQPRWTLSKRQMTAIIISGPIGESQRESCVCVYVCVWWQSGLVALAATKYVTQPQRHSHSCDLPPVAASRVISLASTHHTGEPNEDTKIRLFFAALFLFLSTT